MVGRVSAARAVGSPINQDKNPRNNAKDRQQEIAIGDPQAEQWQDITQDYPQSEQEHPLGAVHIHDHSPELHAPERAARYGSVPTVVAGHTTCAGAGGEGSADPGDSGGGATDRGQDGGLCIFAQNSRRAGGHDAGLDTQRQPPAHADCDGSFDSDLLRGTDQLQRTFDAAGVYAYYCDVHGGRGGDGMSAVITVKVGTRRAGLSEDAPGDGRSTLDVV
jgi:hypothetical protein